MSHDWVEYSIKESPYTGATFAVHMVLAYHADRDTGVCFPKQEKIAQEARVSLPTVERAIKRMCDDGYLVRFKRGRQTRYRVLVSNSDPSPVMGETHHPRRVRPITSEGSDPSPMMGAYRTVTEPSGEPSAEPKSIRAARGGQDDSVKIGNLSDDVEMPESGVAPVKKAPAKTGTHAWAKSEFVRLMRAARCGQTGTTQGVLNSAFKRLRDEGYSNEEIVALAQTFFARHDQDIRAKRREIDPSVMFVQRLPQLKAIKAEEIENKRAGVKTSFERGTEIQREAMKRLGITEESA